MFERLTLARLVIAVVSMALEQVAIWAIWRWLLPQFDIHLHVGVLVGVMVVWGVFGTWLFIFVTRALKKQSTVGLPSMVGSTGRAADNLSPDGMVKIRGELWSAVSEEGNISAGENIVVTGEDGLKLLVRKADSSAKH
jgi:membrane-bound ClpP family serine protease